MILNGKAKEGFLKYLIDEYDLAYYNAESWLLNKETVMRNALIIEWIDSVGIIINILLDEINKNKFKYLITDINIRHLHCWTNGVDKATRQEATELAIIKANEIYNERNK